MKWSATIPTVQQIEQINQMVEEGLKQGALGVGVPVGYMTEGVTSMETDKWTPIIRYLSINGSFKNEIFNKIDRQQSDK